GHMRRTVQDQPISPLISVLAQQNNGIPEMGIFQHLLRGQQDSCGEAGGKATRGFACVAVVGDGSFGHSRKITRPPPECGRPPPSPPSFRRAGGPPFSPGPSAPPPHPSLKKIPSDNSLQTAGTTLK